MRLRPTDPIQRSVRPAAERGRSWPAPPRSRPSGACLWNTPRRACPPRRRPARPHPAAPSGARAAVRAPTPARRSSSGSPARSACHRGLPVPGCMPRAAWWPGARAPRPGHGSAPARRQAE
ncbi:hypothetical protein G6F50_016759 [Rhizopus delemar]|uniref:Uncharacterized protein n=1 Tax=Rhizopus delemar TaxID=936053 RepID=A0A9P7C0Q2_9FUNG|nr:hypothetical protein G6F50_016759 [Rhizopus delemar]